MRDRMKQWRALTWVVLVWNLIGLGWMIYALVATGAAGEECVQEAGEFVEACQAGAGLGGGILLVAALLITALGDVILGVIWLVTRKNQGGAPSGATRPCPHCAEPIQRAANVCRFCGNSVEPVGQRPAQYRI